jgi:hypothetical protein
MPTRRTFLASLAALLGGVKAALAQVKWAPFMAQASGGGGAFTPSFQPIDGGSTFFASNGFTLASGAGFDNPTYFHVGKYYNALTNATKFNQNNDVAINGADAIPSNVLTAGLGVNANQGSISANGTNPWGGIWSTPTPIDTSLGGIFDAIGPETPIIYLCDEPRYWVHATDPIELVNHLSGASGVIKGTSGTKINNCVGRPLWVNFTNAQLGGALSATPATGPAAGLPASMFYQILGPDAASHNRSIDITGIDNYFFAFGNDAWGGCACKGSQSSIMGLSGPGNQGFPLTDATYTFTPIASLPVTGITFHIVANAPVQAGCAVLLEFGGGAGYNGQIGTVTAYNSSTGQVTMNIALNHTYTVTQGPGATMGAAGAFGTVRSFEAILSSIDFYLWNRGNNQPLVTDVTTSGNIPGGTTLALGGGVAVNYYDPTNSHPVFSVAFSGNTTIANNDVIAVASSVIGTTGAIAGGNIKAFFSTMPQQVRRGINYGALVDMFRGFCSPNGSNSPTRRAIPISIFVDGPCAFQNQFTQNTYTTPWDVNSGTWGVIMHGGRAVSYFDYPWGGGAAAAGGDGDGLFNPYAQAIDTTNNFYGVPNAISHYDQLRATNFLILALAPVINSQFVMNFATASPNGFIAPWPYSYTQNDGSSADGTAPNTFYNHDGAMLNGAPQQSFEVMSKQWTGTPSGYFTKSPQYWIWCAYRGQAADGAYYGGSALTTTITIPVTASTVTRFYSDGVIAITAGATTTIQCGNTQFIQAGDTVTIAQTNGTGALASGAMNGTYTVSSAAAGPGGTTFVIPFNSTGGTLTKKGYLICQHTITVTGSTFQDTFPHGQAIGIYRVN